MQTHHSKATTRGIEITARPRYLSQHSDPGRHRYAFGYDIRIENRSDVRVQLLSRHWIIVDADGLRHDVEGEGVVGEQPVMDPGSVYEYSSWCPFETEWGTMEGTYTMSTEDGETFDASIARFYLVAEPIPV